ncbi:MAG: F0F1 ATP synthase subunit A [Alphaproteobacteria bacterium]|nr:F0F1 ATP synthase subunit A [Alphaproteobacteria bacterium]
MAIHSPIEQFLVNSMSGSFFSVAGQNVGFSNFALACVVIFVLGVMFITLPMRGQAIIPGRWQVLTEKLVGFIDDMVVNVAGSKARPFLPFIFSVFFFILLGNLLGLVPGAYTVTSQLVANLFLSVSVIAVVLIAGFARHGFHFFHLFVPSGVPLFLVPVIAPIEVVSFFIRPFSLALRLFANMLAGHILLKVFAGMTAAVATSGWMASVGILPLLLNVAIVGFEVFVAFLQAYIFTILSSVYLRDAFEMH